MHELPVIAEGNQRALASLLSEVLCDFGTEIDRFELLDALATAGIALVRDAGRASAAFHEELELMRNLSQLQEAAPSALMDLLVDSSGPTAGARCDDMTGEDSEEFGGGSAR